MRVALLLALSLWCTAASAHFQIQGLYGLWVNGATVSDACSRYVTAVPGGSATFTTMAVTELYSDYCVVTTDGPEPLYLVPENCDSNACRGAETLSSGFLTGIAPYSGALSAGFGSGESSGGTSMSVGWITDLSPEQGGQLAGAVLAIWAVGWAFRTLTRHLREMDSETTVERD